MKLTSTDDSGYKWITSMIKEKLSCMEVTSPITSGAFVPSFKIAARCSWRVSGVADLCAAAPADDAANGGLCRHPSVEWDR